MWAVVEFITYEAYAPQSVLDSLPTPGRAMDKGKHLRTSVRLRVEKGLVILHSAGVSAIACNLLDMSEGGCRCIANTEHFDEQTAEAWIKLLGPGRVLSTEISCPPHLTHFPIEAEIRSIAPEGEGAFDVGLRFLQLTQDQRLAMNKAILSFATDKVRSAFAPGQAGAAAQYLVGGRVTGIVARSADGSGSRSLPAVVAPTNVSSSSAQAVDAGAKLRRVPTRIFEALPIEPRESPARMPASGAAAFATPAPPQLADVSVPTTAPVPVTDPFRGKLLGEVLIKMRKLEEEQVTLAVHRAKLTGERLGRYLLREGLVTPLELCRALALQSGLPVTDLTEVDIPEPLGLLFSHAMMVRHEFIPFDESLRMLCVAAANPLQKKLRDELERQCGKQVEIFLAPEDLVLMQIDRLMPKERQTDRKHMRYETALPVLLQFCNRLGRASEEDTHLAETLDISEGGFLVQGPSTGLGGPDELMRRGLCVQFTVQRTPLEVKGLCNLRFVKNNPLPAKPEWIWHYGLQILEMTTDDRRKLKEMCIQVSMNISQGPSGPSRSIL